MLLRAPVLVRERQELGAAVDHPVAALGVLGGALDGEVPGGLRHAGVEHLPAVPVEPDLEALPAVDAERDGVAVGALALHFHRGRLAPGGPGADDGVGLARPLLLLQHAAAAGPKGDHVGDGRVRGRGHLLAVDLAPSQEVDVGAAEAAGHDPDEGALHLVLQALGDEVAGLLEGVHVGVGLPQVQVRRHDPPLHGVQRLQEGGRPGRLDLVPDGGLRGHDHERVLHVFVAVRAHQRAHFDRVGKERTSTMGLNGIHVKWRNVRIADGLDNRFLFCWPMRGGDAGVLAVVVHHGAGYGADQRVVLVHDVVAVDELREGLHGRRGAALAPDVAGRGGVEGHAPALGGEPARGALGGPPDGGEEDVHADADGVVVRRRPALLLHRLRGEVDGRGAGGGLRVQRHARPFEAQREGEAAGADTQGAARGPEGAALRGLGAHVPLVVPATHVHAAGRVHHGVFPHAHVVKRGVAHLEDQALVRVHGRRLVGREAEHLAVEEVDAVHERRVPAVGLVVSPAVQAGVIHLLVVPAQEWDVGGVVHRGRRHHVPGVEVLRHGELAGRAAAGDHLPLVVEVVHGVLPVPGDVGVPDGVLRGLLLELLEPGHGPVVELLGRGDHGEAADGRPLLQVPREVEAAEREAPARRVVLVRHEVGAQHHDEAGLCGDLVELRLIRRVGLQLQRARAGAQEDADHDLVPQKLREPLRDLLLVERRCILVGFPCLVD
mmetsp:Transcript_100252/g.283912  ORF Transcript_100252/g.283912 Transcript_100252/m.283912 type:complete len:720 (+) Transcript_100252:1017-3176(+)